MKKLIFTIALAAVTTLGFSQTTPAQKVIKTENKVDTAKARLKTAEKAHEVAGEAYIKDVKAQIEANEKEISRLKSTLVKPCSSPVNDATKRKIDQLEDRNSDLIDKIGQ